MKKLLFITLACITMLGVACTNPTAKTPSEFPVACGGYTDYRELSDKDAALFAEVYNTEPALTPYAIATQVVSGTNYRFLCRDAAMQEYAVTIFVPLPCYADTQHPEVTDIQYLKK